MSKPVVSHWLLPFRVQRLEELMRLPLASARMRAGVALSSTVSEEGIEFCFSAGDSPDPALPIDVLVVGKIAPDDAGMRIGRWLSIAGRIKRTGGVVVIDYTDHHLAPGSQLADFYERILDVADFAICPSNALRDALSEHWWGRILVIEDAVDQEILPPKAAHAVPPRGLWFGHSSNLKYLLQFMYEWKSGQHLRLLVVSGHSAEDLLMRPQIPFPDHVKTEFRTWSARAMVAAARETDYCIIPSDINDPRKNGAGANRLITALALGLPTAADLLPSYCEFSDYFLDIRSPLLGEFMSAPQRYSRIVTAAQERVVPRFSQHAIGNKWRTFLAQCGSEKMR